MLLDSIPSDLVFEAVVRTSEEKARRIPIHMVHRWWSRRFAAVYRLILGAYLLNDEESVREALGCPSVMRERSFGKVFFEPFAGGGTGLAEAALAGFNVYGLDINPVAVVAARTSLLIVSHGLPNNFRMTCEQVLAKTRRKVGGLWKFNGKQVTYIFVSRGRVPTWLSRRKKKKVVLCPYCFKIFESEAISNAICPFCGKEFEVTNKPVATLVPNAPEVAPGWRAFAVELRWCADGGWDKEYRSVVESRNLMDWLRDTASKARELSEELDEVLGDIAKVHEVSRLKKANIRRASDIFAPHQLASFAAYAEVVKSVARSEEERLLFTAAASEAAKCCSLLAKWYSPLGECVPASGVKALWVPEYTAITNPLASNGINPLARGTLASALRAQLKAASYVEQVGGTSNVFSNIIVGDALEASYPKNADLVVLDPPYGKIKSYASLSLTHFYSLKMFKDLIDLELTQNLYLIENRELSPEKADFQEKWEKIIEKISRIVHTKSRVVLIFNALSTTQWTNILEPFKDHKLYPTATYWVLGEAPSGVTISNLRGVHLIIFRKNKKREKLHIVQNEPISVATNIIRLDEDIEKESCQSLLTALRKVFGVQ
jgi:adenine-specific DNA methylase/uncharacterized Zn-finger protein